MIHGPAKGKKVLLEQLIKGLEYRAVGQDTHVDIKGIAYDSRKIEPGYLFVALKGHNQDGHEYVGDALARGAVALIVEKPLPFEVTAAVIEVKDSRRALSILAKNFFEEPFQGMTLIGITGTNGKTTTSYLVESIFNATGFRCGVIGTVNYRFGGHICAAPVTTPESLDLMRALRKMADSGVTHCVIEVSSHALDQGRVRDCPFRVAVFTNISRDHLDYHKTMDSYFMAKSKLFTGLNGEGPNPPAAVINNDSREGKKLVSLTPCPVLTYGMKENCDIRPYQAKVSREGIEAALDTPAGRINIKSRLLGSFNLYNIMAATGAAIALGTEPSAISEGISNLSSVPGRMELVDNPRGVTIVVDYAHTPDALSNVLKTLRELTCGKLITVFGCGGDRDKGKRPQMGRIAADMSDFVIITSDNPRSEDPVSIARDVEQGVVEHIPSYGYVIELDRAIAIGRAIEMAGHEDVILIAGKGHETYQIIRGEIRPFDDREVARRLASEVG